jgi:hypothetical protein
MAEEYPPMIPIEPPPRTLLDRCDICGSNDITCRRKGADPKTKASILVDLCEDCGAFSVRLAERKMSK